MVGAGALGSYFGGLLARTGRKVTLIGRASHVDAVNRDGLLLRRLDAEDRIAVSATTNIAAVRDAGLVLFCVKSLDTETAAAAMAPHLARDAVVLSLHASGKLRGLALTDGVRAPMIPDVPTMAEAGFPNYELSAWFGVAAPAGTPRAVVDKLHAEIVKAARHPETLAKFQQFGIKAVANTPEEFAQVMKDDTALLGEIVKASGARAE